MNYFCFYPHPSSLNHGCEAIAVSTYHILKRWNPEAKTLLLTKYPDSSEKRGGKLAYDLYDNTIRCEMPSIKKWSATWFLFRFLKLFGKDLSVALTLKGFTRSNRDIISQNDVFVSIGGDNYCYGRPVPFYAVNRAVSEANKPTVSVSYTHLTLPTIYSV